MTRAIKSLNFLLTVLFTQILVWITIIFDIQGARQIIGFFYLTLIPGFIVLKLLRLDNLAKSETIVFSTGLSIAFMMLAGLLLNEFGPLLGLATPLASVPLSIVSSGFVLAGGVLVILREENNQQEQNWKFRIAPSTIVLSVLPVLSVIGAIFVNTFENNQVLLFNIIAISLLFIIATFAKKLLPSSLYPFTIVVIAVSIILHSALISNYISPFASDVPLEYYIFKTIQSKGIWTVANPFFGDLVYGRLNSMLSVTILPIFYASIMNVDSAWVFKLIYPLILALIPLGLYTIWRTYFGEKSSFIAAFLLIAQSTFYTELLGLNRQIIGELFFVLLLFVMLKKELKPIAKLACFMIFSIALVTSHYGLAEIFLLFIFSAVIFRLLTKHSGRNITISMAVLFSVLMFSWYLFTSGAAVFESFVTFSNYVYGQLGDFLNPASRGKAVLLGLGADSAPSVWNALSRAFAYITQVLIIVGFIGLITKRVKVRLERDYFALSLVALVFLALLILIPGLAETMNMSRFYHILLFFLAPLCSIGAIVAVRFVIRKELLARLLLVLILVPYFLFQTGFMYEVTGSDNWSVPLSSYRMDPLRLYGHFGLMDSNMVFGARWLSENVNLDDSTIYADDPSRYFVLPIYGLFFTSRIDQLSNVTMLQQNSAIYLSTLNTYDGLIFSKGSVWNSSYVFSRFGDLDKVYTNGGSEVYKFKP